jgi:hypothetical protein
MPGFPIATIGPVIAAFDDNLGRELTAFREQGNTSPSDAEAAGFSARITSDPPGTPSKASPDADAS